MQSDNVKLKLKDRAFQYAVKIIEFIDTLPKDITNVAIMKQLIRSITSIGANIVEAQAASSKIDFTRFFIYSLKSANESLFWLELLKNAKKVRCPQLEYLLKETSELSNILAASILTLKKKREYVQNRKF